MRKAWLSPGSSGHALCSTGAPQPSHGSHRGRVALQQLPVRILPLANRSPSCQPGPTFKGRATSEIPAYARRTALGQPGPAFPRGVQPSIVLPYARKATPVTTWTGFQGACNLRMSCLCAPHRPFTALQSAFLRAPRRPARESQVTTRRSARSRRARSGCRRCTARRSRGSHAAPP